MWIIVLIQTVGSIVIEFMRRRKMNVKDELEAMKSEIGRLKNELRSRK